MGVQRNSTRCIMITGLEDLGLFVIFQLTFGSLLSIITFIQSFNYYAMYQKFLV